MSPAALIDGFYDDKTGTVSYVVAEDATNCAAGVDPVLDFDLSSGRTSTAQADRIVAHVQGHGLQVEWILETHAYADHLSTGSRRLELVRRDGETLNALLKRLDRAVGRYYDTDEITDEILAVALRELGRIERTLFILDWLQSVELRRRVHAGLNVGEACNALARAVFFYRLGEIRDRSFEQQPYRASGLNLLTAAIVLWNTVYMERAVAALHGHGQPVDEGLLRYLSPLGWEHINLTGNYLWRSSAKVGGGRFRPLRPMAGA